jgi:hypothetical protein
MILPFRRRQTGAQFVHPTQPAPRTAILAPGFEESKAVRVFPSGWNEEAARFAPVSIAGSVEELRKVADRGYELRHAVIVLTYDDENGLSSQDRDFFWEKFGVPVYEQQLGPNNELLAMECDAHNGLHLTGDFPKMRGERNSCACGNPAPRLPRRPKMEMLTDLLP